MSNLDVAVPLGYAVLPTAVAAQSAGVPVPGETALIAAAIRGRARHVHIALVFALGAAGAIAGDNLGYLLGRRLGRPMLLACGPARRLVRAALRAAASLFARYGGAAVLVGRFFGIGRIAIAWLAGADEMPLALRSLERDRLDRVGGARGRPGIRRSRRRRTGSPLPVRR